MEWANFNTYGHTQTQAFEMLCSSLFEKYCYRTFSDNVVFCTRVDGSGGDGGLESYALLKSGELIALQAKWFINSFSNNQIAQIQNSLDTALKLRPEITKYVVCIPRDLTSLRIVKGKRVSKNTQEQLWDSFITKNKKLYNNVEIVLWNNLRITEELANTDSQGLAHFWFDNTIILDDEMKSSYQKAILSWAKVKYIPDLYSQGHIHSRLDEFLSNPNIVTRRKQLLDETVMQLQKLQKAYNAFEKVVDYSENTVESDLNNIDEWLYKLLIIKPFIENGGEYSSEDFYDVLPVNDAVPLIKASALFQADAAEELQVYPLFYKRKTTLKMIF